MKLLLSFLFLLNTLAFSQSKNPDEILKGVIQNFDQVKDYVVDVSIKVDIQSIKVPETKAKIYFKQPDKVHLEADGFAMLPKNGMQFSPVSLLKEDYTAIYNGEADLNRINTSIIKVIPSGEKSEIILSTMWVDQKKKLIRKIEATTKMEGTFTIEFTYDGKIKYPLPSQIVFSFNLDKMNLPSGTQQNNSPFNHQPKHKMDSTTKGRVFVNYSNYIVNKGINDNMFEENKK